MMAVRHDTKTRTAHSTHPADKHFVVPAVVALEVFLCRHAGPDKLAAAAAAGAAAGGRWARSDEIG